MIVIERPATADSGVAVQVHGILRCEIGPDADAVTVHVGSWPSDAARLAGRDPAAVSAARIPLADLLAASGLMGELVTALTRDGWLAGGQRLPDAQTDQLAHAKAVGRARINAAWAAADAGTFAHTGVVIDCGPESRRHIETINGYVAANGVYPVGFPGQWKARDNSYLPLPDVTAWRAFYGSMVAQGLANFGRAQALKAAIDAAPSIEAAQSIDWATPLPVLPAGSPAPTPGPAPAPAPPEPNP